MKYYNGIHLYYNWWSAPCLSSSEAKISHSIGFVFMDKDKDDEKLENFFLKTKENTSTAIANGILLRYNWWSAPSLASSEAKISPVLQ